MSGRTSKTLRTTLYILYVAALSGLLFYLVTHQHSEATVWVMTGVMAGGTLMLSVYGFSLYRTRPQERALLFFAGYCLAATLRMLFLQNGPGPMLFPALGANAVLTLRALGTLGSGAFHFNFVFDLFGEKRSPKLRLAVNIWMLSTGMISLVLRLAGSPLADVVGLAAGIPMLILNGVLIAASGKLKKNPVHWIFFVTTIIDIFSFLLVMLRIPNLAIVWNFVYTISITFFMADRYAKAMTAVETVNETLEETVAQRTAKIREVNRALAESEQSIRELVRGISHDLKTPLSVLGVNLEMLREGDMPLESETHARYVDTAWQKSRDLTRLIQGLFEAARMEAGQQRMNLQWTALSSFLSEVHQWYAADVESGNVTFSVSFDRDCQIWLDMDATRRVLDNLISNALRYTPEGGRIDIQAGEPENGTLPVVFSDTGSGIAPEHLPYIFDAYYKADASRSRGDSGLGLFIVKSAMEGMEGGVTVESEQDSGTAFTLTFRCRKISG